MATLLHRGVTVHSVGELPPVGKKLRPFSLTGQDMADFGVEIAAGRRLVLNIFPSVDTGVCAMSVRRFNELAAGLTDTLVLCVSADLPYAHKRFCGAEGIENVTTGSSFRSGFGLDFGLTLVDGKMRGLLSRAVLVADKDLTILHAEQVSNISTEPDYDAALAALS
ncbi:MAG: thiol peroxidase [Propionibacteriaceae bacterium]|nr:thiol peroxidase [Propionibacteriaceae bacterium]